MEWRLRDIRVEWRLRYPGRMATERHPGGMAAVRHPEKMGCRPGGMAAEVSEWNGAEISGWNVLRHKLRTLKNYGNLCICLTPRKPVLHNLYQVPTFLGMLMIPVSENTKVKKMKKRRYRCTQKRPRKKRRENREKEDDGWLEELNTLRQT